MALKFFFLFLLLTIFRALISNISLFFVLRWLKSFPDIPRADQDFHFVIVIPVLKEQKVIKETLQYFLGMKYPIEKFTLLVVSTGKETTEFTKDGITIPSTGMIVDTFTREINQQYGFEVVKRIHYPDKQGKMVDQVNYAFDHIRDTLKISSEKFFVCLYNADSRPSLETLSYVANLSKIENGRVYQQSALFFDNWEAIGNKSGFLEKKYLLANGVLHSRWTLVHEIPRLFRQSYALKYLNMRMFLSHCVGHGLFLRGDFLKEIKSMPVGTVTEDLFFGYVLSLLGEPIRPLPVMEIAEMPSTFWGALNQKYVWFFGPLDHFSYESYFTLRYPGIANTFLRKWFTLQGILPAFIWLFQGWILLYIFWYPIIRGSYELMILSISAYIFYAPFSYWLILKNYSQLSNLTPYHSNIRSDEIFWVVVFSPLVTILHSFPPIFSLYSKVRFSITGKEPVKSKTER